MSTYNFEHLDELTAGTIGPKGKRTFFLQLIGPDEVASLKIEKRQLIGLAENFALMMADAPAVNADDVIPAPELLEPENADWIVADMRTWYASTDDQIVVVANRLGEDASAFDEAKFGITRAQAVAFIERIEELVSAGRPLCLWCEMPLNHGPDGFCNCWN